MGNKLNLLDLYVLTWKDLHDTLREEAHCKITYGRWSHFKIKSALKSLHEYKSVNNGGYDKMDFHLSSTILKRLRFL